MRIDIRKLLSAGIILTFLQTLFQPTLNAQSTNNFPAYFPSNYSEQPIITFKEGFLNKITYYVDGEKSGPQEVALLLESGLDGRSNFTSYQRKKIMGTAMNFTGLAVNLGSFAYLFTHEITPNSVRPWYLVTLAGGLLQGSGDILLTDAKRRIGRTIDDYNELHYSQGAGSFLGMDVSFNFLGASIDIYEGPMLLKNEQALSLMSSNQEAHRLFEKVTKRQQVSKGANIANMVLEASILFVALGFERQSSSQNQILLPLTFTGIGLNLFSNFYERRTRNLAREALYLYNFDQ